MFRESGSEIGRGGGGGCDFGYLMFFLSMLRESYSSLYDFGSRMEFRLMCGGVFLLFGMSILGVIYLFFGFGSFVFFLEVWGIGVSWILYCDIDLK